MPTEEGLLTASRRFMSGAVSGALTAALLQPLDVIKTTQQSVSAHTQSATASMSATARGVIAHRGALQGLWAGLGATVTRVFLGAGLYFCALHSLSDAFGGGAGAPGAAFAAGAIARSVAAAVVSPIAVVKTRLENGDAGAGRVLPSSSGAAPAPAMVDVRGMRTLAAMRAIAQGEGGASLFSGLVPTVIRDAPFSGLYYAAFTALRAHADASPTLAPLPVSVRTFASGVAAGALATLATHPADVIRTRLQLRGGGGSLRSIMDGAVLLRELRSVLATRGARGFAIGLPARTAKRALSTALTWTLFEMGMSASRGAA